MAVAVAPQHSPKPPASNRESLHDGRQQQFSLELIAGQIMKKLTANRGGVAKRGSVSGGSVGVWRPAQRRSAFVAAKAVGSYVPKLTQKAFEKFGFSTAALLTDWAVIAGEQLAAATLPERVKWPRGAAPADGVAGESHSGATLVLRVDPSCALDVEYKTAQIIERINSYFGYRAVSALRLLQAPVEPPAKKAAPAASPRAASATLADVDPLSAALARYEACMLAAAKTA